MSPSTTETDEARIRRFLAIASHDLQSPLRHIAMYAEILLDDIGDRLDAEHLEYLTTILVKAQTAQGLTKALVGFASGAPKLSTGDVDVVQLVRDVWAELKVELEARDATIEIGDLFGVRTDAAVLQLVLKVIIANAIQHRGMAAPRVHVDAVVDGPDWTMHISDNGPGIAPEHQDNIFTAFWALQPETGIKRPGLGLTTARELCAALGGSVRLDHSGETGSRFSVRLPIR